MANVGKVELLSPAGNMECLQTALNYGADAVYLAGKQYGLRAFSDNFGMDELAQAVELAHGSNKKIYVTVNAIMREADMEGLYEYLCALREVEADAVILSDPGVLTLAKKAGMEIHLSTQASTSNALAARFWYEAGVKRIVVAREMSLEEIAVMRRNTPPDMEIEAFIHGAMCIAYSGRCLLSSVLTGRSGNKGMCAQPCRWEYSISEAGYPGQEFPIMEDGRGTYILNSKDLMMIEHIGEMIDAGICSFKIEGRMKSAYYVGCVTNAYRRAVDAYQKDGSGPSQGMLDELLYSATRRFTTGFFFGNPHEEGQDVEKSLIDRKYIFCGMVLGERRADGLIPVEQRNKFSVGDTLRILSPKLDYLEYQVERIVDEDGNDQDSAPHPQQKIWVNCPYDVGQGDMLRKKQL